MHGSWGALGWGLLAASSLVVGAALGTWVRFRKRTIAWVMAFGSGVLISALAFELMEESFHMGGLGASAGGFLGGAVLFTVLNVLLARRGAKHRKRSAGRQPVEATEPGSGAAIALGAFIDGIPESVAIGVSLLGGATVSFVTVVAVFLSNVPEGLSSADGMRAAGRSRTFVFALWGAIVVASGLASFAGFEVIGHLGTVVTASALATAGGAILAMLVDTMIPEAFDVTHDYTGLIAVLGFLTAFVLGRLG